MNRRISILGGCFLVSALFLMGLASWLSPAAYAEPSTVITVDTMEDELNDDGDCSLREAVEAANTDTAVDGCLAGSGDDTINLPSGTYTLTLHGADEDANQTGDLDILDNLTINGAASGGTIIDGDASDRILDAHGITLVLNDLQITNGYSDVGGGIRNRNGNVELYRCLIRNNISGNGGGLYNRARDSGMASMMISDTQVLDNNTDSSILIYGFGGGILNAASEDGSTAVMTVTHSLVAGNATTGSAIQLGGGIGNVPYSCSSCEARLFVEDSTVRDNISERGGGIISGQWWDAPLAQAHLTIHRSTLSRNSAIDDGNGSSDFSGGGLIVTGGTAALLNSTLSDNFAQDRGGGLVIVGASATATVTLTNTTIVSNTAGVAGGGLAQVLYTFAPSTNFKNTLIADNTAPVDAGCTLEAGILTSLGYNLESGGTCPLDQPTDLPNTDPLLGPLQDNGGETWTHALLPLSPALDAGDDAACPSTDQRGVSRPQDGDGDGAADCDIGSFEAVMEHIYMPLIMNSQISIDNSRSAAANRPGGIPIATPTALWMLAACVAGAGRLRWRRE